MHPEGTKANLSNCVTEVTVKEFQRSYEDIVLSALKHRKKKMLNTNDSKLISKAVPTAPLCTIYF